MIIDTSRNAEGTIRAIMYHNAKAEIALRYCDIIITVGMTLNKAVVDANDNES
jgi:hypothetical protein